VRSRRTSTPGLRCRRVGYSSASVGRGRIGACGRCATSTAPAPASSCTRTCYGT
jgi:hypothetical protein